MDLKKLFLNKINIEYDLKCILECVCNENNYSFILKNITGTKKIELLGSDVSELDLNLLFSENFRLVHNNFMIDILTFREKSKFWNLFLNGKMNRIINIINPITKYEYGVKLQITFNSQSNDKVLFDVFFTDVNIINKLINNTGLLTHDLRSIIKSAQNIVNLIQSDLNTNTNTNSDTKLDPKLENRLENRLENFLTLKELLNEAYEMCSKSRTKLIVENINKNPSKAFDNIKIYLEIFKYIKKIKNIFPNIKINLKIKTNLVITSIQNDALWHLFLNMVKNSSNANSNKINIIIDEKTNEPNTNESNTNKLLIYIQDNGCGMSESTRLNFFTRELPSKINSGDKIDSNRGEGFLLAYKVWVNLGGDVEIISSIPSIGTEFLIKCSGIKIVNDDGFVLSKEKVELIQSITEKNKIKIFLIDDSLLNLKILSLKLIKFIDPNYKHNNFPILTSEEWQNNGIIQINICDYIFLLLSNGMYGKEICMMIEPNIIITDIQMPLLNGIDMIKTLLDYGIKSKIFINSAYSDKDNDDIVELVNKYNVEFLEKGSDISNLKYLFDT